MKRTTFFAVAAFVAISNESGGLPMCTAEEPAPPATRKAPTREISQEGYRVLLDLSNQVLRLDAPEDTTLGWDDQLKKGDVVRPNGGKIKLFHGNQAVATLSWDDRLTVRGLQGAWVGVATKQKGKELRGWVKKDELELSAREAPIHPTLAELGEEGFVSAAVLAQKAKQFDDGLYAAVELAAESGLGNFRGKVPLLQSVARGLAQQGSGSLGNAPGVLLGAAELGKLDVDVPAKFNREVRQTVEEFSKDELRSKPLGFYTWNKELANIFRQDRMLQSELKGESGIEALVKILAADSNAKKTYKEYLTLISRLTGPLIDPVSRAPDPDLRKFLVDSARPAIPAKGVYFFPPSVSHETRLIMQLYGNRPIPDGFSLIDELIKRIRSGDVSLKPTARSGWYDYQTWALEPLVIPDKMPEAKHLEMDDRYKKHLVELFKGLLALTRETHVKQVDMPAAGAAAPGPEVVIYVYPELSAEPLATYYLRRALGYRFARTVLEETFGPETLKQMYRQTATAPVEQNLAEELGKMETLFFGAYVTVCRQIGMTPDTSLEVGSSKGSAADAAQFQKWAAAAETDPDVGRDARMMVPVFYDIQRRKTKVWAFLGWSTMPVEVAFARHPAAAILDKQGNKVPKGRVELNFEPSYYTVVYPVTAEVYVDKILNRDEFRRLCDQYKTREAILANLK